MADSTLVSSEAASNACRTLNDLGEHVHQVAGLLRAAINTGADQREDEGWLLNLAHEQAERLKARYMQWADPSQGVGK